MSTGAKNLAIMHQGADDERAFAQAGLCKVVTRGSANGDPRHQVEVSTDTPHPLVTDLDEVRTSKIDGSRACVDIVGIG